MTMLILCENTGVRTTKKYYDEVLFYCFAV